VTTAPQQYVVLGSFNVLPARSRADLISLLKTWTAAIAALTTGVPVGPSEERENAPVDTGESADQGPSRLTVTVGFGASLFDDRFGLAMLRPPALADLPVFRRDSLDPTKSGGDIAVQVCADRQIVVEHALRNLARVGRDFVALRWRRNGFNEPLSSPAGGSPRNLFGFRDGTSNPDTSDDAVMQRNVWVPASDGPAWMVGGTYQVYREVHLDIERWDDSPLGDQEDTFGRYKLSGAPYGGTKEHDVVDVSKLPATSHVRVANPRTGPESEAERILRRGYNFDDGFDASMSRYRAGLAFIAYQRDPRRQFVTIQQRLAATDELTRTYAVHTASGLFAVPPGVSQGDHIGSLLLQ
jgi:deferrochelatase/peroxidase EfeB